MKRSSSTCALVLVAAGISFLSSAHAASEKVIYSFPANSYPFDRVLEDVKKSSLYATSYSGGAGYGNVIQLSKVGSIWRETTLSEFSGGADGQNPIGGLTEDDNNILYGTTVFGGAFGGGTIFQVTGSGSRTVLYNFTGGADGYEPESTLLRDKATGTFYGTTALGGSAGCGTVFQLASSGSEKTIYSFAGGTDGCSPERSLYFGRKLGVLYGSTKTGGTTNNGTVFTLIEKSGAWKEKVIYNFGGGSDGSAPTDLAVDTDGTIYGVAESGGPLKHGVVFQLTQIGGGWREAVIYNFRGGADGTKPIGLHLDQITGVLYGTTEKGGAFSDGTAFSLTNNGSSWTETLLHSFGAAGDGVQPRARITEKNKTGVLYGTTAYGGQFGGGTIYQITP